MRSRIDEVRREVIEFILKNRKRQKMANMAGIHLNTLTDILNGHRPNCSINTLIKLERVVNGIKEKEAKDSWYYSGPKTLKGEEIT